MHVSFLKCLFTLRYRISVLCNEDGRIRAKLVKVRDAGLCDGERALPPIAVREWETTCGAGTAFATKIFQTRGRDLNAGTLERGLGGTRSVYIKNVHEEDWQGLRNEVEYEEEGPDSSVGDDYYSDIKVEVSESSEDFNYIRPRIYQIQQNSTEERDSTLIQ